MKCKIFQARSHEKLQDQVNEWLKTHAPIIVNTQFSTVKHEDDIEYWLIHTLVLFYVPQAEEEN